MKPPLFSRPAVRPRPGAGFTLLELLVTIGVVIVLAVLLTGTASRTVENSRRAKCVQNLSSLGKGFLTYLGENQFGLPTAAETAAIQPGATAPSDWIFAVEQYVPYQRAVYLCPSNPARFKSDKVTTDRETNYAINYWMREGMITHPMFRARISPLTLPAPAKVGLLLDGAAAWIKKEQPARVALVHRNGANVLFLDGHVQTQSRGELFDGSGQVACLEQPDKIP